MAESYCEFCKKETFFYFRENKKNKQGFYLIGICNECGMPKYKAFDSINSNNDIGYILLKMRREDNVREYAKFDEKVKKIRRRYDKKRRINNLYNETKNTFSLGGAYYKQNPDSGDYFLQKFSYGPKKTLNRYANKKVRQSKNLGLKGSNYKKLYNIDNIVFYTFFYY